MVVAEYKIRNATVRIHDDYMESREESLKILERVEGIIMKNLIAQQMRKESEGKNSTS